MPLFLSVPNCEEQPDATGGRFITLYVVRVEDTSRNLRYLLPKRYSSFEFLYNILKLKLHEVEQFRFPEKSMFNNHSQLIKEKRRQSFESFLQLLASIRPLPMELEEFLELDDNILKASAASKRGLDTPPPSKSMAPIIAQTTFAAHFNEDSADSSPNSFLNSKQSSRFRFSKALIFNDNTKFLSSNCRSKLINEIPAILRQAFLLTIILYFSCVSWEIIDVSGASSESIILTILTLGSVTSLLYIFLYRLVLQAREDEEQRS